MRESTFDAPEFNIYVNWLYSRTLQVKSSTSYELEIDEIEDPVYLTLTKLCFLADYIKDTQFQEAVFDAFKAKASGRQDRRYKKLPQLTTICKIYDNTENGSLAREVLAELYATGATKADLEDMRGLLPAAFLEDLTMVFLGARSRGAGSVALSDDAASEDDADRRVHKKRKRGDEMSLCPEDKFFAAS